MFRNGFTGDVKSVDAMPLLVNGSDARTAEADGAEITKMPLAPMKKTPRTRTLEEAWEYYHTPPRTISDRPGLGDRAQPQSDHSSRRLQFGRGFPDAAVADRRGQRGRQQMDERRAAQTRGQQRQEDARRAGLEPHEALRRRPNMSTKRFQF
jgi:hypothetical protein